ncbi:glutamine--fructose-6-phosphate transaminase [Halopenitus malekzadehii]|uniref:Glutamine--fructose-6-phosphate aminotransferase [isomerizing] n=1 Tax=Halopenitus malekzadehii TaxID=1267564 RepID=A0A1H6IB65_9EURY|nr:glutamine--fructose-6-phosphate transaminase (isomerizing) [Halopenitus malekzadehii]SEH46497.1 glutamine--fructose-6-phosphate transaminase [Halopenitus malekzadehii]
MCGIIGYVGDEAAAPIVYQGLENLEYRGYDSAGIALVNGARATGDVAADGGLTVAKRSGEVSNLTVPDAPDATCGIGHTRWSTHGPPTDANAHPHVDCAESIAVVHNGIIENHEALKAELGDHEFTSETDTEVVPHLLESELSETAGGDAVDLRTAVERVVDRLEGSYAVCAIHAGENRIVAARDGSPLVVGHGEDAAFLASDVTAFLEHTREVTYLEDGDVVDLSADGDVEVFAPSDDAASDASVPDSSASSDANAFLSRRPVDRSVETVEWEADAAEKAGYEHYMRKEIHEQPTALRQTLSGRVDVDRARVDLDVSFPEALLERIEEVQIVACGTSYYAGRYAARLIESFADVRTTVEIASEYAFGAGRDPDRTLTIAVTQSGETADTLGAIRRADSAGARTLAVTNTLGSSVTRAVDDAVFIRAGPEIGVAATKTFASQVTTLALLAVALGRERGTLSASRARSVLENLRGLPGAVQQALDAEADVVAAAEQYRDEDAFFFLGRDLGVPVALEGALKLKEIAYDHAEGFPAGELKHGPLALVTDRTPVLAVLTEGGSPAETMTNVTEAQTRGADAIGCVSADREFGTLDVAFEVPDVGLLEPLVANVYFQLFAYHVANEKSRAIDKPRNLAKSVTVE